MPNVVVLGSGPAGLTAALYLARANLSPVVYEGVYQTQGGQLTKTSEVDNFPGFPDGITGPELVDGMRAQATRFGARMVSDAIVEADLSRRPFRLRTEYGAEWVEADAIVVATGATANYLGLESEQRLIDKGVSACATCDAWNTQGRVVAVVGGGDSAVEEATFLAKFADKVHLIHRRGSLRASKVMQDRLFANPKVEPIWHAQVHEVLGEDHVEGLVIEDVRTGDRRVIEAQHLFLAIGHTPSTAAFAGQLATDADGYLILEPGTRRTSVEGVFAAGDVADRVYRQAVTAAGTGCAAALELERWLESPHG